jgi:hypothetical protein
MTMHHERRSLYRVAPGRRDALRVTIEPARGAWPAQAVVDLNAQGLGATFSHADTPDLEVGDRARIRITGPLPGAPFELDSVLAMRAEKGGRRHLGFRFEAGPLARGMAQECYRVFNRRSCYRATLPDDEPALVWPGNAPGTELALHVRDVSLAGMSAWTDAPGEDPLAQAGSLALSFRLPQRRPGVRSSPHPPLPGAGRGSGGFRDGAVPGGLPGRGSLIARAGVAPGSGAPR